jgi:hypothetical protein
MSLVTLAAAKDAARLLTATKSLTIAAQHTTAASSERRSSDCHTIVNAFYVTLLGFGLALQCGKEISLPSDEKTHR